MKLEDQIGHLPINIGLTWPPFLLLLHAFLFPFLFCFPSLLLRPTAEAAAPITTSFPPQADAFIFTSCSPHLLPLLHFREAAAAAAEEQQGSRLEKLGHAGASTFRRLQAVQIGGKGLNSSNEPSILSFMLEFLDFHFWCPWIILSNFSSNWF